MSLLNFVPELWSAEILQNLNDKMVMKRVSRDYSADLIYGDKIHLTELLDVTVGAYTPNSTTLTPAQLQTAGKALDVDTFQYFSFYIEEARKSQLRDPQAIVSRALSQASFNLMKTSDTALAALFSDAGISIGTSLSPKTINSANVIEYVTEAQKELGKKNAFDIGKSFMVIPYWFAQKLTLAGYSAASDRTASRVWENGMQSIPELGFNFYVTNNLSESSEDTNTKILFGIEGVSLAFAHDMVSMKELDSTNRVATEYQGLYKYGCKVVYNNALGVLYASAATEA